MPLLCLLPAVAHAQHIPAWLAAAAVSPIAALLLVAVLAWLKRSWRVALTHALGLLIWVASFLLASAFVTNDLVIWTPLALYTLHCLLILGLLVRQLAVGRQCR